MLELKGRENGVYGGVFGRCSFTDLLLFLPAVYWVAPEANWMIGMPKMN